MKKAASKSIRIPSAKGEDQPATRKMLYLVRDQLGSQILSLDLKIDARFKEQDAKFSGIDGRFFGIDAKFSTLESRMSGIDSKISGLDAKISGLDSRMSGLESKIEALTAETRRSNLLVEEQRADNRIVLEGLQLAMQRLRQVEQDHRSHT